MASDESFNQSIFAGQWPEFLVKYKKADYEMVRLLMEKIIFENIRLGQPVIDQIKNTLLLSSSGSTRPCPNGLCKTVDQALTCHYWENHLRTIFNEEDLKHDLYSTVLPLYWLVHSAAYERWEDSFDYNMINCCFHISYQLIKVVEKEHAHNPDVFHLLNAHKSIALRLHHSVLIENSMITNNPFAMHYHALSVERHTNDIIHELSLINSKDAELNSFAAGLGELMKEYHEYSKHLSRLLEYLKMLRNDPEKFQQSFPGKIREFNEFLETLEDKGDYEDASEFRAHLSGLKAHLEHTGDPRLVLKDVKGILSCGFYIHLPDLSKLSCSLKHRKELIQEPKQVLNAISERLRKLDPFYLQDFNCPIVEISEDPPIDITNSSLGEEHFYNLLILFKDIRLNNLRYSLTKKDEKGDEVEIDHLCNVIVTPKLIHYAIGVGTINFEIHLDELSIPEFHELKNMASPHSGQYELSWTDISGHEHCYPRFIELAQLILDSYKNTIMGFYKSCIETEIGFRKELRETRNSFLIDVEHSWFANFSVHGIYENRKLIGLKELETRWEYPGLIAYQRADKATVDDWISIRHETLEINNLAHIRAHRNDLFIVGENHAIAYFNDDPNFIVLQYLETAKWTFIIRSLIYYTLKESQKKYKIYNQLIEKVFFNVKSGKEFKIDFNSFYQKIEESQVDLQRFRSVALTSMEHVASISVSQYADHASLLRHSFINANVHHLVTSLKNKIDDLDVIQQSISGIIEHFHRRDEKRGEKIGNSLLLILTLVLCFDTIYKVIRDSFTIEGSKAGIHWLIYFLPFILSFVLWLVITTLLEERPRLKRVLQLGIWRFTKRLS